MASNVITALNLRIGFDISEFETKNQDMRKALARTTTILRSMATPAEKLANDIAAVTMVAKEQEWETKKLDQALEHLNRKYDLTGQYAREAKQAQDDLAASAKRAADDHKLLGNMLKSTPSNIDLYTQAMNALDREMERGREPAIGYSEAVRKIEEKFIILPKQAEEAAEAMAYLREELEKIDAKEKAVSQAADRHAKALERVGWGASQYDKELQRLSKDFSDGFINANQYRTQLEALREYYERAPARAKATADEEERLNNARSVASKYIIQEISAAKQYRQVEASLKTLLNAKRLTNEEFKAARKLAYEELVLNPRVAKGVQELAIQYQKEEKMLRLRNEARANSQRQAQAESSSNNGLANTVRGLVAAYASFATLRAGLKIASDMEQAKIAFEVMAGSAEDGKRVFQEIREFAAKTPITFEGAQKAGKTLLQFGVENERVTSTLKMLGDVAAGDTQRLEHLSLAFGQVVAAGRLTGQETLQMVNQGFNPLQQIAEDMAKEFGGLANDYFPMLKQQMEQGNISAEMVAQAIESATSAGGRFAGMTDKMGETAGGAFNQLIGAAQNLVDKLGESVLPVVTDILQGMTSIVEMVTNAAGAFDGLGGQLMIAAGAGVGVVYAITQIIGIVNLFRKSTMALNAVLVIKNALSGPVGWGILAVGATVAAGALYKMKQASEETEEALKKEEDKLKEGAGASEEYRKSMEKLTKTKKSSVATAFDDIRKGILREKYQLEMSAEAFRAYELEQKGFSKTLIDTVIADEKFLAGLKEAAEIRKMHTSRAKEQLRTEQEINDAMQTGFITRQEAAEKLLELEDKRLERVKQLEDAGKAIQEKYNPVSKVAEQIAEMNVLLATGNITQEQYFAERNKLLFDNIKKLDMTQPEAMEAGSAQAAQFMQKMVVDEAEQQINELKAQTLLQQASLQAQQETNRRLADLKPVQLIR